MKKYYNLKFPNLQGLFNYIESTNEPIVTKLFSNYFQKKKRMSKEKDLQITTNEYLHRKAFIKLLEYKMSEPQILNYMLSDEHVSDKHKKFKVKQLVKKILDSIRETNEGAELIGKANEANKYLDSAYKLVGIYED
jgi:hypothetical protein